MIKKRLKIIAITSLLILTPYVFHHFNLLNIVTLPRTIKSHVNFFTNQGTVDQYTPKGRLSITIKSPKIMHLTDKALTTFTTPQIVLYPHDQPVWYIQSKKGTLSDHNHVVHLTGSVSLTQHHTRYTTVITTPEITSYPAKQIALSHRLTRYDRNRMHLQGKGVKINFKNNQVLIQQQSRFHFTPTPS